MIYIVEIPHQRQPFCWSAHDEAEAISKMWHKHIYMPDTPEGARFAEWVRYNGLELHSQYVFMDAASAIDGLTEISGHNAVQAIAALREELRANGELPEEPNEALAAVHCPYCQDQGYTVYETGGVDMDGENDTRELHQERCQFCHETPNSVFNITCNAEASNDH